MNKYKYTHDGDNTIVPPSHIIHELNESKKDINNV